MLDREKKKFQWKKNHVQVYWCMKKRWRFVKPKVRYRDEDVIVK